jgi:Dynamin GTPase effector domain
LDKAAEHTRKELRLSCRKELHRPFTLNKSEYIKAKSENVTAFAASRHQPPRSQSDISLLDVNGITRHYPATEENFSRVLIAYGYSLPSSKDLMRLYDDDYRAELDVISHVVAYFDLSSKRLIDDIPQVFETVFARDFGEELGKDLTMNLNLVGERGLDSCARYIRDESDVQAKRDQLIRLRHILDKAKETVDRFYK